MIKTDPPAIEQKIGSAKKRMEEAAVNAANYWKLLGEGDEDKIQEFLSLHDERNQDMLLHVTKSKLDKETKTALMIEHGSEDSFDCINSIYDVIDMEQNTMKNKGPFLIVVDEQANISPLHQKLKPIIWQFGTCI